jgi:iron complex outermembrane receptor protein
LKASIIYENFANRDDNAMTRVGLPTSGTITDTDIVRIKRNTYLGEPAYDFTDSYGTMLSAYLSYAFNHAVSVEAAGRRTTVHFDQAEVRTLGPLNLNTLTVPRSRARELLLDEEQYNARALVRGTFATGQVTHDLTIGFEYFDFDLFVDTRSVSRAQVTPISVVDPVYRDQLLVAGTPFVFTNNDKSNAIFLQDVVRLGPLTATGAIRKVWSDFSNSFGLDEKLEHTLYQIGAAYEVVNLVSVFAGYNTGFDANSGIAVERSRTGDCFDPEDYRQVEVGVKTDALSGVTATVSLFELTRKGILVTDPVDAAFLVQVGEERSRGFETDLVWAPTPELALRAGYLYLDSEITKDTDQTRLGNRRPGAPEHRANGFASYTFLKGLLQNLRLSAGIAYVGDAFASLNNGIERPDYIVVDFGASYTVGRIRLDAFLSNAFDERYFIARNDATVNAGDPQFFRLRAAVQF